MSLNPKELAQAGYIRFDLETGLTGNGKTVCAISDDEKRILAQVRSYISGRTGHHDISIAIDGIHHIKESIDVLARTPR